MNIKLFTVITGCVLAATAVTSAKADMYTITPNGLGGSTILGPGGMTTVTPNALGGATIMGPTGTTTINSNGLGGYQIYDNGGYFRN